MVVLILVVVLFSSGMLVKSEVKVEGFMMEVMILGSVLVI